MCFFQFSLASIAARFLVTFPFKKSFFEPPRGTPPGPLILFSVSFFFDLFDVFCFFLKKNILIFSYFIFCGVICLFRFLPFFFLLAFLFHFLFFTISLFTCLCLAIHIATALHLFSACTQDVTSTVMTRMHVRSSVRAHSPLSGSSVYESCAQDTEQKHCKQLAFLFMVDIRLPHATTRNNKQQHATTNNNKQQTTSNKQQATSNKQQATSNKQQATSNKQQANSQTAKQPNSQTRNNNTPLLPLLPLAGLFFLLFFFL